MKLQCPICHKEVQPPEPGAKHPSWFPFCSERCKLLDLGKWLDAEYSIPADKPPEQYEDENLP